MAGLEQDVITFIVQKLITFGIGKFSAWKGKYTTKQIEEALEDLQAHPEKYWVLKKWLKGAWASLISEMSMGAI